MKLRLIGPLAFFLLYASVAAAHRLDEYLQATILSVGHEQVHASMRLLPGIAVSSGVIAAIDINGDGIFSDQEKQAYANRVLHDLTLTIDGQPLTPKLTSLEVPEAAQLRDGLGEIHVDFTADLPSGTTTRKLILENHHQTQASVYLVNALAPDDPTIHIEAQKRNEQQSIYELDFTQSTGLGAQPQQTLWTGITAYSNLFHLGMHHIAEGTDHLLFLLVLLLPAPLLVMGHRWAGFGGVRRSVTAILKIVTAFTIGHSATFALAASHVISVPSRPVEVLIAVSILVSAIHALRPIFPGKEAAIAAFFGLIHGLAFAATLSSLGLGRWERLAGILSFNLGIEAMQLIVVATAMPLLLLLSRTRVYAFFRIGGALFAAIAAIGWIFQRMSGSDTPLNTTHQLGFIAGVLIPLGLIGYLMRHTFNRLAS